MVSEAGAVHAATATLHFDVACQLGESPVWCARDNVVWWTDIEGRSVWRQGLDEPCGQRWDTPGRVGCLALCTSGGLLLGMEDGLYRADPRQHRPGTGLACTRLCTVPMPGTDMRINDGRLDRAGNLVFGAVNEHPSREPVAHFHQYSRGHGLRRLALPPAAIGNGICFTPDGTVMYYCDSLQRRIMQVPYDADTAQVGAPREFAVVDAPAEPDGAVVDAEGTLWSAQWGAGQVVGYSPQGAVRTVLNLPARQPTCPVIAGSSLQALLVTSARSGLDAAVVRAEPANGGVLLAQPAGLQGLPEARFNDA